MLLKEGVLPLKAWRADQVALRAGESAACTDFLEADEAQGSVGGRFISKGRCSSEHAKAGPALRRRQQVSSQALRRSLARPCAA